MATKRQARELSESLMRRYDEAKRRDSNRAAHLYSKVSGELDKLDSQDYDSATYNNLCDELRRV